MTVVRSAFTLDAPLWALSFIRQHLAPIAVLVLVPTAERMSMVWWKSRPAPVATMLELLTLGFRLLLVFVVVRLMLRREPRLADGGLPGLIDGAVRDWPALLVQLAMFGAVFAGLGVSLERAARLAGPDLAALTTFTVRNVVVIPFAVVWLCGIARQFILANR